MKENPQGSVDATDIMDGHGCNPCFSFGCKYAGEIIDYLVNGFHQIHKFKP